VGWPASGDRVLTPETKRLSPRFVFVTPGAEHLGVDWGQLYDVRDRNGAYILGSEKAYNYDLFVTDPAFYVYGNESLWTGAEGASVKPASGITSEGAMLAFRFDATRRLLAKLHSPADPHGGGGWAVEIYGDRFASPDRSYAEPLFQATYPGRGVAAIADDWRTVVAMEDQVLRILAPSANPATQAAVELAHVPLPFVASTVSLAEGGIVLTSKEHEGAAIHFLDGRGTETWSARLSFLPEQPAIDAANGRIVLAGAGLGAVEKGHVLWSEASHTAIHATAFQDGTLAVTTGPELRIVDRDGSIRQSLRTSEDDVITTPPAIAHDGTVWVATQKALYVAR
jgi:hypothetical protein